MKKYIKRSIALITVLVTLLTYIQLPENDTYGDTTAYNGQTAVGNYTIGNTAQLNLLAQKVNSGINYTGSTFTLTNNIVYDSSIQNNYTPIGGAAYYNSTLGYNDTSKFSGIFDGNGFTISGINIYYEPKSSYAEYYKGVFGRVFGAKIKNLGLINSSIIANEYVGGIAGFTDNTVIDNCYIKMTTVEGRGDGDYRVGGIAGYSQNTDVKNSYSDGTIFGGVAGGIVGQTIGSTELCTISNCINKSKVNSSDYSAGIVAKAYGNIFSNCVNMGTFSNEVVYRQAGIVIEAKGCTITDCKNYSYIYCGSGIVESLDGGRVSKCENYGIINGSAGIVGYSDRGMVEYSSNYGNINGLAGICGGSSRGAFYCCYNVGDITTNGYKAKDEEGWYTVRGYPTGIVGYSNNVSGSIAVYGCYSTGSLLGTTITKYGLVGYGQLGTKMIGIDNSYYLDSIGAVAASLVDYNAGDYKSRERTSTYMKSQEFVDLLNKPSYGSVTNPFVRTTTKNNGYPILWYQATVESITINGTSSIEKGDTAVLKAEISPTSAPNKTLTWATSDSSVADIISVGDNSVIVQGINKGTVTITAKAQDGSGVTASKTINVVSSFVSSKAKYILVDDVIKYNTTWKDSENDSLYSEEYRYIHNPYTFENSITVDNTKGYMSDNNIWTTSEYTHFSKVGTYKIQYRVQDNPPTANKANFENYRYYSDYVENTIYVHRKPIAVYFISKDTLNDSSFDLDHSISYSNKGIAKWEWTCISNSGIVNEYIETSKINGVNSVNAWISSYKSVGYKIILRVQDIEGAWSEPTIKGVNEYSKPVADFSLEKDTLLYPENQTITDLSYDTNGLTLSYKWTVSKDNVNIMTSTNNDLNSELNSKIKSLFPNIIGEYSVSLQVINSAGIESNIVTKNFKVIVSNKAPTVNFDLVSNESPVWSFPKILGLHTLKYRPTNSLFFEEKSKFNIYVTDLNTDNLGFDYSWKLERFMVKEIGEVSGAASNTYSYTTQYPFTNSFKNQGLGWGAYRITLSVTDRPPVPPYNVGDKKTTTVTKNYYIIPEISLIGSFESTGTEVMVGDTIKLKAKTDRMTENVLTVFGGTEFVLSKVSEDSNFAYWEKNITIPESITESGTYQINFKGTTSYGGNGNVTREVVDSVPINIITLKLIDFRITDIVNHPDIIFPYTKDMLINKLIPYKTGYYLTFRIDSKGKPDNVWGRVDVDNNGSIEEIISMSKVASGDTETWQGRFYVGARLPINTVISIKLDCKKCTTVYDYNQRENWDGRSLIIDGSALMDGRINLTN